MAPAGEALVDRTPLDGARIDIGPRIGWLLRSSRVRGGLTLRDMAAVISADGPRVSFSTLSRLEAQGIRAGGLIDAYERALELPSGQLRAPIDILCRTFDYAPPDTDPQGGPLDLDAFSAAVDAVTPDQALADHVAVATGGEWLRFARLNAAPNGFGLPRGAMAALLDTLVSELVRSVAPVAYATRYEALALLRCSAYAGVVEEAIQDFVSGGPPAMMDVFSVLGERPSASALAWCGQLVRGGTPSQVRGAVLAVENMRSVGGLPDEAWQKFVPDFLAAYDRADADQRAMLTRLFTTLSPTVRRAIRDQLAHDLVSLPGPREWTRSRRNVHYSWVELVAERIAGGPRASEQPMLARLLFELLYDFRATRSATSVFLLNASPYAYDVHTLLTSAAEDALDEMTRDSARAALLALVTPPRPAHLDTWLVHGDAELARLGHILLGHAGVCIEVGHLDAGIARGGGFSRSVVYAAGMAGHPHLRAVRDDRTVSDELRQHAGWFLRNGARVAR